MARSVNEIYLGYIYIIDISNVLKVKLHVGSYTSLSSRQWRLQDIFLGGADFIYTNFWGGSNVNFSYSLAFLCMKQLSVLGGYWGD